MRVITICGSCRNMKLREEMINIQLKLAKAGNVVLLPIMDFTADRIYLTDDEKELYAQIHFQKIAMSDAIYVVNIDRYIGESTRREIEYATIHGKEIMYYEN